MQQVRSRSVASADAHRAVRVRVMSEPRILQVTKFVRHVRHPASFPYNYHLVYKISSNVHNHVNPAKSRHAACQPAGRA